MNEYYVYEYIRLDINEPFYVGKGTGYRCWDYKRERDNKEFDEIVKNYPFAVNILEKNLTNDESCLIEVFYIYDYTENWNFNLVNKSIGGRYTTNGLKRPDVTGDKNPMRRPEFKDYFKGKRNPNYGKGYRISGEKHPLYGKGHTEESKKKMSLSSIDKVNSRSRRVRCVTTGLEFDSKKLASKHYNIDDSSLNKHLKRKENPKYKGHCGTLPDGTKLYWEYVL